MKLGYERKNSMKKKTKNSKEPQTTYDQYISKLSKKELEEFEEGYREMLLSELLIAAMSQDGISVRSLAEAAGVSPTIVQDIKTDARKNVSLQSLTKILDALGYQLVAEKKGSRLPLKTKITKSETSRSPSETRHR